MAPICLKRRGLETNGTTQTHCNSQSRRLTLFGHIAHMDDNEDAKRILSTGGYLEDAPHHMAEHHTAGSEIPQSHTA